MKQFRVACDESEGSYRKILSFGAGRDRVVVGHKVCISLSLKKKGKSTVAVSQDI